VQTSRGGEIHYRLNDRDEIVFLNEAWGPFAVANGDDRLAAAEVLGRPLWEFISDPTTRHLYRDILARARRGAPVRFTFRCDSPSCRRVLAMDVSGGPGGAVEFRTRVLSEEAREPQPLLERDRPRSEEFVRMCGWCKKVDVGGRWAEVEEAVARLGLFDRPLLPRLTHGICEDCYARMIETLRAGERPAEPGGAADRGPPSDL
jgi:hypothetical protein